MERFTGLVNPGVFKELKGFAPDVIVVHGYAHATEHFAMLTGRLMRIPVLLRGESNLLPKRSRLTLAAKRAGSFYLRGVLAGALAIGTHSKNYFRHYGFPEDRIFVAPYAVDNDFFQSQAAAARATAERWRNEMGIAPDTTVIGFAAKLSPVKACGDLIEAFGRSHAENAALVIVGDGPLRAELEAHAARFPNASIYFRGFVNQSDMPAAYAIADVFVLPSNYEPWGLAVNEAMNLACPVIVSEAVSCAVDLVGPDNGWVFPSGDISALQMIITKACANPDRLKAMGEAALDRICRWGIPETAAAIVDAAKVVTASNRASPHAGTTNATTSGPGSGRH